MSLTDPPTRFKEGEYGLMSTLRCGLGRSGICRVHGHTLLQMLNPLQMRAVVMSGQLKFSRRGHNPEVSSVLISALDCTACW